MELVTKRTLSWEQAKRTGVFPRCFSPSEGVTFTLVVERPESHHPRWDAMDRCITCGTHADDHQPCEPDCIVCEDRAAYRSGGSYKGD